MNWLASNWYLLVALAACIAVAIYVVYNFVKKPRPEQLDDIREWLLGAVTKAEKKLGGGTGQLKLRMVYDMFLTRFPGLSSLVSFAMFSDMVDEALVKMREMLATNDKIKQYVEEGKISHTESSGAAK